MAGRQFRKGENNILSFIFIKKYDIIYIEKIKKGIFMHAELKKIAPVHNGKFINYYNFLLDDGRTYEVVSRKNLSIEDVKSIYKKGFDTADAVDIIAFNEDYSKILVIKEWRVPANDYVYAFPAGLVEPNEEILHTASRELFEETGLKIIDILDILTPSYQSVGMTDEAVATIICRASGELTNKNNTLSEDIIPMWITKEEAKNIINKPISCRCQIMLAAWALNSFSSYK